MICSAFYYEVNKLDMKTRQFSYSTERQTNKSLTDKWNLGTGDNIWEEAREEKILGHKKTEQQVAYTAGSFKTY